MDSRFIHASFGNCRLETNSVEWQGKRVRNQLPPSSLVKLSDAMIEFDATLPALSSFYIYLFDFI